MADFHSISGERYGASSGTVTKGMGPIVLYINEGDEWLGRLRWLDIYGEVADFHETGGDRFDSSMIRGDPLF
jgi:hypothetical protein